MIRTLLVGMARTAFGLALVALVVGGALVYFAFRLIHRAFRNEDKPIDARRTALFGVLLALVALYRSFGGSLPTRPYDARHSDLVRVDE